MKALCFAKRGNTLLHDKCLIARYIELCPSAVWMVRYTRDIVFV